MSKLSKGPKVVEFARNLVKTKDGKETGPFHFSSYSDEFGNAVFLQESISKDGVVKKALINFPKGQRIIRIPEGRKDANGQSYVEFIRNSPYCKGSPLCNGEGLFFEINLERDAKIKIDEVNLKRKALNLAADLEDDKALDVAALYGVFNKGIEICRATVLDKASFNPREFIEIVESKELGVKAVFKKAFYSGLIVKEGKIYVAVINGERTELTGPTEEKVIEFLKKNNDITSVIKEKLNK